MKANPRQIANTNMQTNQGIILLSCSWNISTIFFTLYKCCIFMYASIICYLLHCTFLKAWTS